MSLDHIKVLKVRELRDNYDPEEVNLLRMMTPRSEKHIHSPTRKKDHYTSDDGYVSTIGREKVLWDVDLDETLHFLTGSRGSTDLLAKNVKCEIEELERDDE